MKLIINDLIQTDSYYYKKTHLHFWTFNPFMSSPGLFSEV